MSPPVSYQGDAIANDGDSISTRRRSFLGHCEAVPINRRFPPPWSIEDIGAAFVVKDAGGQKLGYFYCEEEPRRLAGLSTGGRLKRCSAE
jgi:hypothetical protein